MNVIGSEAWGRYRDDDGNWICAAPEPQASVLARDLLESFKEQLLVHQSYSDEYVIVASAMARRRRLVSQYGGTSFQIWSCALLEIGICLLFVFFGGVRGHHATIEQWMRP